MDAFGMIPNIIATIETTYKVIKFFEEVKSSGLECSKYMSEASSSYIILQQVRDRLKSNVADGHTVQPWSRHLQALAGEDGVLKHYKSDMEEVANILLEVKNYRFRRVFVWHREKQKIEDIFNKVERHKSAIQLALTHDQLYLSDHTYEVVSRVGARIEANATLQATEKAESNREEIIEWIYQATVNHDNFQRDYNAAAHEGTGKAFLSSDTFRRWLEGISPTTIFCPGLPGAGKTVMASIVKSHLDERMDSSDPTAVLYFNYKRHLEDHDHRALLLAILAQFLFRSEKVPDHLQKMFDKKPREPLRMDDTISILESLVESSQKSFLIMDALDEFYDDDGARSRFLHLIQRLQASGNLSIMMTARPHLTDDPAISKWSNATIQITASDDDLHTYLDHKICGFPYLPDDFELRLSIADRIVEASAGIFLLAVLHADSLKDAYNAFEVEDILENMSKGPDALNRAYEDAIKRIDHQPANRQHYARLTISWLVQCLQPMSPRELQHAVTKPEHLERGLSASGLVKIDALVSFCAGLVTIDHESNVVRFVHYTTQEYFTRDRLTKWLPGAELDPARLCTQYMMNSKLLKAIDSTHQSWTERVRKHKELMTLWNWQSQETPDDLVELDILLQDVLVEWPFLAYCKKHWGSHCSQVQTPLQDLLLLFLTGPAKIVYCEPDIQRGTQWLSAAPWGDVPTYDAVVAEANLRQVTPISICSRCGLNHLISNLLDQGSDIKVAPMLEDQLGNTEGNAPIVTSVDDAPSRHVALDEPFLLACQNGNMELAALLLARTSICDDVYYEAFHTLDQKSDLNMLELIITRCPLDTISLNQIAMCSSIDESRIKISLLDRALHISPDGDLEGFRILFGRPSASFWVGYLLEQGMDINKTYPRYETGVELAAAGGCLESVRTFLKYPGVQLCRADEDPEYTPIDSDALGHAAHKGHWEVLSTLMSHVSNIPGPTDLVQFSVGRVFEHLAARYGPFRSESSEVALNVMKSLLEYPYLNQLPFNKLEKAIHSAVSNAMHYEDLDVQDAILDLILHKSSIDFHCRGIHGLTLLQTAVPAALANKIYDFDGSKEPDFADDKITRTLRMLLNHPSFDYTDRCSPISEFLLKHTYIASTIKPQESSSLSVIRNLQMILEDSRFHPDTPDESGRTALSYASEFHIEYFVRMLIQHPLVDVNSRDVSGRTPLSYAAEGEHREPDVGQPVLPILLGNDKVREQANCPDTEGITPLMYSCRLARGEAVRLLLDIVGSEANLHDNRGRTPLLHALENPDDSRDDLLAVLLANPNIKVNATDKDGRSPLFYALRYQSPCPWLRSKGPDISLLLQHEDLDISGALQDMRDDDGWALDRRDVLRSVKLLRERVPASEPSREWTPLSPTELRNLDLIESIFSVGHEQSDTSTTYLGSEAGSVKTASGDE